MVGHVEIERRWLIKSPPLEFDLKKFVDVDPGINITQAYIGDEGSIRVRIYENLVPSAELTTKIGKGISRIEENIDISLDVARLLCSSTQRMIQKVRYAWDGWELDFFKGSLSGLVLLERELTHIDEVVPSTPEWLGDVVDVTETLSNKQLAMTSEIIADPTVTVNPTDFVDVPLFVLTGGPCSGKSTAIARLKDDPRFHCVPEVASILMGQVGIKPSVGVVPFQRTLYRIQRSFEEIAIKQAAQMGKRVVILDRGTLDSAAFIDGGLPALAKILRIDPTQELTRYAGVIMFDVIGKADYVRNMHTNPVRTESWQQALDVEKRLMATWKLHPTFKWVTGSFDDKMKRLLDAVTAV